MSWRIDQIKAQANRPLKPERDAVVSRVFAMLGRMKSQGFGPQHNTRLSFVGGVFTPIDGKNIELAEAAQNYPHAWEALCEEAASYVENGEPLPDQWRGTIALILRGKLKKPPYSSGPPRASLRSRSFDLPGC